MNPSNDPRRPHRRRVPHCTRPENRTQPGTRPVTPAPVRAHVEHHEPLAGRARRRATDSPTRRNSPFIPPPRSRSTRHRRPDR